MLEHAIIQLKEQFLKCIKERTKTLSETENKTLHQF